MSLRDTIFHFYNNNDKRISDGDIYQILLSYRFNYTGNFFKKMFPN